MAALGAVCCRGMLAGARSTVLCVAGAPTGQSHPEGPSSSSGLAGSLQRPLSAEPVVALQAGKKKELCRTQLRFHKVGQQRWVWTEDGSITGFKKWAQWRGRGGQKMEAVCQRAIITTNHGLVSGTGGRRRKEVRGGRKK